MSDKKAVIKNADMSEDMQSDVVECATQALEKYNIEKDIAAYIKKEFDKKYRYTNYVLKNNISRKIFFECRDKKWFVETWGDLNPIVWKHAFRITSSLDAIWNTRGSYPSAVGLAVKGLNSKRPKNRKIQFFEYKEEFSMEKMLIFLFAIKFCVSYDIFQMEKQISELLILKLAFV